MIGSPLWHPMRVPYPSGYVASVILTSLQTMRTDTVTWTIHNKMDKAEGDEETRVIGSDIKHPRSV